MGILRLLIVVHSKRIARDKAVISFSMPIQVRQARQEESVDARLSFQLVEHPLKCLMAFTVTPDSQI